MPVGIHELTLRPEVREEDFEKFMIEEVFPVVRTVIKNRIGRTEVHHALLKSSAGRYLWTIDVSNKFANTFPTDIGEELRSRLDAFVTGTFSSFGVLARASEELGTPTGVFDGPSPGDPSGFFGPGEGF